MYGNIIYFLNLKKQTVAFDVERRLGKVIIEEGEIKIA